MILKGKVWKFGDNISTDHIAPGRLFHLRSNLPELAKHVLEDADPEFAQKLQPFFPCSPGTSKEVLDIFYSK